MKPEKALLSVGRSQNSASNFRCCLEKPETQSLKFAKFRRENGLLAFP